MVRAMTFPLGRRLAAALVDGALQFVVFLYLAKHHGTFELGDAPRIELEGAPWVLLAVGSMLYFVVLEARFGATLGKYLLDVRVVGADGEPPGFRAALVRNLLRFVDALPVCYIVGVVVIALTPGRQRIGDLFAGTLVVGSREGARRLRRES